MLRHATLDDIDALLKIENLCFATDRLSRRSFRHLLTRGNAATLVDEALIPEASKLSFKWAVRLPVLVMFPVIA